MPAAANAIDISAEAVAHVCLVPLMEHKIIGIALPYSEAGWRCLQKLRLLMLGLEEDVRQVWRTLKGVLEELDQQSWSEDDSEIVSPGEQKSAAAPDSSISIPQHSCHSADKSSASSMEVPAGISGHESPVEGLQGDDEAHADAAAGKNKDQVDRELPDSGQAPGIERTLAPAAVRLASVCEVVLQWGRSLVGTNLESLQYLLLRLHAAARDHKMFAGQLKSISAELEADVVRQYGGRISLKPSRLQ